MDTIQLKKILENDFITKSSFQGVYASDQLQLLQKPNRLPACYVINEDPASKPGSHWVALYLMPNGDVEYFDSYGDVPIKPIEQFARRLAKTNVWYNTKQLQSFETRACGPFCIFYLLQRNSGRSMNDIVFRYFTTNSAKLLLNDYFVRDFVCQRYQIHLTIPVG